MTRIRVDTDRVREVGRRIAAEGERLAEIGRELGGAIAALETTAWDGVSRARAAPLLDRVGPAGAQVAQGLSGLAILLARVADAFEQEDGAAARSLAGMAWVDWDAGGPAPQSGDPPDGDPRFDRILGATRAQYGPISGRPFLRGRGDAVDIHPNDIDQGRIGNCYLLAALAGIALQRPAAIREMIRVNDDGTYTVTLYERPGLLSSDFTPVEVVVTSDFPLIDGQPVFAGPGDFDGQPELWPMLVEKAYASHHGGYNRIEGGWGNVAMEELAGAGSERFVPASMDLDGLADRFESGHAITASSLADMDIRLGDGRVLDIPDRSDSNPWYQAGHEGGTLVARHEYYVAGVDRQAETVTIRNPWGWHVGEIVIPFAEFQEAFRRVSVNPLE